MKSLSIFILILLIVYLIVYYKRETFKKDNTVLEIQYRRIPYSVFDQTKHMNIKSKYNSMFERDLQKELYSIN